MIDITFEGTPFSINQAYRSTFKGRYGHTYMTPEAVAYKESIKKLFKHTMPPEWLRLPFFSLEIRLLMDFVSYREGLGYTIKRGTKDNSNCIKLLEDAICEALHLNDSVNRNVTVKAFHSEGTPKTRVIIKPLPAEEVLNGLNFYQ